MTKRSPSAWPDITGAHDIEMPPSHCWNCNYLSTRADGTGEVQPGCPTICINCNAISVITDSMQQRKPNPFEKIRFESDPDVKKIQWAIAKMHEKLGRPSDRVAGGVPQTDLGGKVGEGEGQT